MGLIETLTDAAKLAQKLDNIELVKTILGLQQQCYELIFENKNLREETEKAKEALRTKESLVFRNNAYWINGGADPAAGPICSTCWDANGVVVRMHSAVTGYAHCKNCDTNVPIDGRVRGSGYGSSSVIRG